MTTSIDQAKAVNDAILDASIKALENYSNPVAPQEDVPSKPQRTGYLGVYENRSGKHADKPFRAALCVNKGKPNVFWMNLGYFKCEHVAAAAYNVASLNTFKGKGYLNPVNHDARDQADYQAWTTLRAGHIKTAVAIHTQAVANNQEFRIWELKAA